MSVIKVVRREEAVVAVLVDARLDVAQEVTGDDSGDGTKSIVGRSAWISCQLRPPSLDGKWGILPWWHFHEGMAVPLPGESSPK